MMRFRLVSLALFIVAISANASTFTRARLTQDPNKDVEPTVTRQTANGVTATIVGWIRDAATTPRVHYLSRGSDGQTFTGMLGTVAGFSYTADPYLAPNQAPGASFPQRTYMVGAAGNGTSAPDVICLWTSDDAGRTWSAPKTVARTASGINFVDKPHITVSQYSGAPGHVYVAYARKNAIPNNFSIRIARSTNGGESWLGGTDDVEIYAFTNSLNAPQVVMDGSGFIYVLWIDYDANKIMMARSPGAGTINGTWFVDTTGPSGPFFRGGEFMTGNLKAQTIIVAQYNVVTNKLIVAWHEKESAGSNKADVYIAQRTSAGWQPKQKLNNETCFDVNGAPITRDQFRPAFDYKSNGELYVTYYSRQRDCTNNQVYDHYFVRLGNGIPFPALEGPRATTNFLSNPALNCNAAGECSVGEYMEVWCDPTICYNAWIGTDQFWADVFLTTIQ